MPIADVLTSVPDLVLDTISAAQDAFLSTVSTLTESAKPLTDALPAAPFADQLPDTAALIESTFATVEKLVANQKDFALRLASAYGLSGETAK